MKLGSLREGRDGRLVVVDRRLTRARPVPEVAPTLQAALDRWLIAEPQLREVSDALNAGETRATVPFEPTAMAAPLPRAYQWLDAGAYLHHMELARRARGAPMPPDYENDPAMHQGASDDFRGPTSALALSSDDLDLDFEAEIAIVTDDVPAGVNAGAALAHVKLFTLVNDVTLRRLIPAELAKGVGFLQSKPANAFAPVAVTPDELGAAWADGKVHVTVKCTVNGVVYGAANAGVDMAFSFPTLIAHAARTRRLRAGSILGAGTISNRERSAGSCCLAERRMLEVIEHGAAVTPYLRAGDRIRIEMLDSGGTSVVGAIEQQVLRLA